MQFFKTTTNYDFMGRRRTFLILSGILVLISLLGTIIVGPNFGIDFKGGSEIQVEFQKPASPAAIRKALKGMGFKGSEVVSFGVADSEYLIRLQAISPVDEPLQKSSNQAFNSRFKDAKVSKFSFSPGGDKLTLRMDKVVPIPELEKAISAAGLKLGSLEEKAAAPDAKVSDEDTPGVEDDDDDEASKHCQGMTCTWRYRDEWVYEVNLKSVADRVMEGFRESDFGEGAVKKRSEWVGPKVGKQLRVAGVSSLVYALLFIMLYIAVRFDLRFAPGAVVALVHDVIITMGIFTLIRVEVTLATVAALLTIVGYSLNDTIVVFDRIRENLVKIKERRLDLVVNTSINETLARTVLTSLTTLLVVVVILSIGWRTSLRDFALALFIGVFVGTYSSIFIASPIVVWLDKRFDKKRA